MLVPASLTRTAVYRRVPLPVRSRLDEAILLRPEGGPTVQAIAEEFKLAERYGITPAALRSYARRLEELIRPVVTSHLMAAILGCLPEDYRQQLVDGSRVLLISRVVQALNADAEAALPLPDLAKLASILSAAGRTIPTPARGNRTSGGRGLSQQDDSSIPPTDPTQMAEAVRMLYGLSWPLGAEPTGPLTDETSRCAKPRETDTPASDSRDPPSSAA